VFNTDLVDSFHSMPGWAQILCVGSAVVLLALFLWEHRPRTSLHVSDWLDFDNRPILATAVLVFINIVLPVSLVVIDRAIFK